MILEIPKIRALTQRRLWVSRFPDYVTGNLFDACVQETFAQTRVRAKKCR
jgi:hypothetical protein